MGTEPHDHRILVRRHLMDVAHQVGFPLGFIRERFPQFQLLQYAGAEIQPADGSASSQARARR